MNVLGRAKENSGMFWVSADPIFHCLLLFSQQHLFLIPVALSQMLISLAVCPFYPNLTGYFKIRWALIISLVISIISLLGRRIWRQFMFWDIENRDGISYVKWNTMAVSKDSLDVTATGFYGVSAYGLALYDIWARTSSRDSKQYRWLSTCEGKVWREKGSRNELATCTYPKKHPAP